jgi:hypothetical protein
MKRGREKGESVSYKEEREDRKENMGSKRAKKQNKKELRQKGHDMSREKGK